MDVPSSIAVPEEAQSREAAAAPRLDRNASPRALEPADDAPSQSPGDAPEDCGLDREAMDARDVAPALGDLGGAAMPPDAIGDAIANPPRQAQDRLTVDDDAGSSLHEVGLCLSSAGQFESARTWFERAAAAKEKGDANGRVDYESVGGSLHHVGYCLSATGQFEAASSWFERAIASKEKGDIFGRVDHASLKVSLRVEAVCLRRLGHPDDAEVWEEQALSLPA